MKKQIQTKIVTKTVHEVFYKDQWGRWISDAQYDDKTVAETKGVRAARRTANYQLKDWGEPSIQVLAAMEPGKYRDPGPHGDR